MSAYWTVKNVEPLKEYRILLTFEKGIKKIFDMKPYLKYPMYKPLENTAVLTWCIRTARLSYGMTK